MHLRFLTVLCCNGKCVKLSEWHTKKKVMFWCQHWKSGVLAKLIPEHQNPITNRTQSAINLSGGVVVFSTGEEGCGSFVQQYCATSDWHPHTHSGIHLYTPRDSFHASERVSSSFEATRSLVFDTDQTRAPQLPCLSSPFAVWPVNTSSCVVEVLWEPLQTFSVNLRSLNLSCDFPHFPECVSTTPSERAWTCCV